MNLATTHRHLVAPVITFAVTGLVLLASGCREHPLVSSPNPDQALAVSHILVAFDDFQDQPNGQHRTRAEAYDRARRIALLLRTNRGDLARMAQQYSDDPTAATNAGYLGAFNPGDLAATFEAAVCSLRVGEIGGPVETPLGFHVIRREPVQRVHVHHLLVAYHDAALAARNITRDRAEAARIAGALHSKIKDHWSDLCELTEQFSDDDGNRAACGDLGWVEPGLLDPDLEEAVFALDRGKISDVVESRYGFHIFWLE